MCKGLVSIIEGKYYLFIYLLKNIIEAKQLQKYSHLDWRERNLVI